MYPVSGSHQHKLVEGISRLFLSCPFWVILGYGDVNSGKEGTKIYFKILDVLKV